MENNLGLLGLAKKAGLLEIGEESVRSAARAKKARLILSAADAADSSKRHAAQYAEAGNTVHLILPTKKFELGGILGRGSPGMMAITDFGIAATFAARLAQTDSEAYGEAAQLLAQKATRAGQRKKEARAHDRNIRIGKRRTKK